jgi:hypothetical protein
MAMIEKSVRRAQWRRAGKTVSALTALALLSGCVVVPAYGPGYGRPGYYAPAYYAPGPYRPYWRDRDDFERPAWR